MSIRTLPSPSVLDALAVERDRVIDLVRILSLVVVIAGHSLMLTVGIGDSSIELGNLLTNYPVLQAMTWVFQIMPLFFFAGAAAAVYGWRGHAGPVRTPGQWLFARTQRLIRPVFWYLVTIVGVLALLRAIASPMVVDVFARLSVQLLWFLGAYLLVLSFIPVLQRMSAPRSVLGALAVAVTSTALIDMVRLHGGPQWLGMLNFITVWAVPAIFGVAYAKRLIDVRVAAILGTGAVLVDVLLVVVGPYEVSLVTIPGQQISNMSPPSLLLAGHAIVLCGLVIAGRRALAWCAARPRVWWWTVFGNSGAMTLYLWHLPVLAVIVTVGQRMGFGRDDAGTPGHLVTVVVETGLLLALMLPVLGILSGLENGRLAWWDDPLAVQAPRHRDATVIGAVVVAGVGLLMMARHGLTGPGTVWLGVVCSALVVGRAVAVRVAAAPDMPGRMVSGAPM